MRKKNGAADDDKPSSAEMNDLNAMLQVRVCVCVDLRAYVCVLTYALPCHTASMRYRIYSVHARRLVGMHAGIMLTSVYLSRDSK